MEFQGQTLNNSIQLILSHQKIQNQLLEGFLHNRG